VSIDEIYEKHGDLEEIKRKEQSMRENAYKRFKTWDFPKEEVMRQNKRLEYLKLTLLNTKLGWQKLAKLRNPKSDYVVLVLRDNSRKIELIFREIIPGSTTRLYREFSHFSVFPIVFWNDTNKTIDCAVPVNAYETLDDSEDSQKSSIKYISIDLKRKGE
jgi:hypothetical protein